MPSILNNSIEGCATYLVVILLVCVELRINNDPNKASRERCTLFAETTPGRKRPLLLVQSERDGGHVLLVALFFIWKDKGRKIHPVALSELKNYV